jgi:DHA1 family bicyclomycin/chloramphenicol resistance-like MFS transporter
MWFVTSSVSYMIGNAISGRFSVAIGLDRMVVGGTLMALVAALVMGVLTLTGHLSAFLLFASMAIVSIGNGCSQPNAMAGAISVDPRYGGTAAGISGFLQMSLGAVTTAAVGHFLPYTDAALGIIMSIALTLSLASILLTRRRAPAAAA